VQFSIQVAAYTARREATATATRLRERGFDVRVIGDRAPYRVRIGRYPTRAAAMAALARLRESRVDGIVVEAEPK
jgi:cell division protein FtsN